MSSDKNCRIFCFFTQKEAKKAGAEAARYRLAQNKHWNGHSALRWKWCKLYKDETAILGFLIKPKFSVLLDTRHLVPTLLWLSASLDVGWGWWIPVDFEMVPIGGNSGALLTFLWLSLSLQHHWFWEPCFPHCPNSWADLGWCPGLWGTTRRRNWALSTLATFSISPLTPSDDVVWHCTLCSTLAANSLDFGPWRISWLSHRWV